MAANRTPRQERLEEMEALWALVLRVLSFVLGAVMLIGLLFFVNGPIYAWLIGVALCSPTAAASVATMAAAIRGKGGEL
ncbi:MAG: hypothetical protein LC798_13015 [Chloroflexi bacterium]|nr:hypothetical protein [Chloroflexota bacterium]